MKAWDLSQNANIKKKASNKTFKFCLNAYRTMNFAPGLLKRVLVLEPFWSQYGLNRALKNVSQILNYLTCKTTFYRHIQLTRQLGIIDNGESLVKIFQNFWNLMRSIIYYITLSFTFVYALMFGKRMELEFHRTKKVGLLKRLTP